MNKKHQRVFFIFSFLFLLSLNFFLMRKDQAKSINPFSIPASINSIKGLNVNRIYTKTVDVPLNIKGKIKSFHISGSVKLNDSSSYVRVILKDNKGNEYAIFDSSSYYSQKKNEYEIKNFCDETCILESLSPKSLVIEINNGQLKFKNIGTLDEKKNFESLITKDIKKKGLRNVRLELFAKQRNEKIKSLKDLIKIKGNTWIAGETSISKMSYAEKKKLFGNKLPNLQGFEYYKGGIFVLNPDKILSQIVTNIVPNWDWRDRHGINWMTNVKRQFGCESCSVFSSIAATESNANIYFNKPNKDLDLSEQDVIYNAAPINLCDHGMWESDALDYIKNTGAVEESCQPYLAIDLNTATSTLGFGATNYKCNAIKQAARTMLLSYDPISLNDDGRIKEALITRGPLVFSLISWDHAMTLVGYKPVPKILRVFLPETTIWIFKNSWGVDWGENGYANVIAPQSDYWHIHSVQIDSNSDTTACEDRDGDGYCYWGLENRRPANCPAICKAEKDCNDASNILGPFDNNYNCTNLLNKLPEVPLIDIIPDDNDIIPVASSTIISTSTIPQISSLEPSSTDIEPQTDRTPNFDITTNLKGMVLNVSGEINYWGIGGECEHSRYSNSVIIRWGDGKVDIPAVKDMKFQFSHDYTHGFDKQYDLSVTVTNGCFGSKTEHQTIIPQSPL